MKKMIGLAILILSVSLVLAGPYVTVIFEYTVGPDGSRRNLHVVRVEDPPTHQELKGALTKEELAWGRPSGCTAKTTRCQARGPETVRD